MYGLRPSPVELYLLTKGSGQSSSAPRRVRLQVKRGPSGFHARCRVGSPFPGGGDVGP